MVGGMEKYFQFPRALRDEDLRADRGFEHTQADIEMSFVERDDVMNLVETMMTETVESMGYTIKTKPFPRISYKDALATYGADKFDMRTEEEKAQGILAYAWVIDFPMFEAVEDDGITGGGKGKWTFSHNPFSAPMPESMADHAKGENIENIVSAQYDLVCNGFEAGGGSIRAHTADMLKATYKIMGYSEDEIQKSVGHILEAFKYGTPPHGGLALGVERNIMNLTGEAYLREVQAFPQTRRGQTAVMNAPSELSEKQLKELGLEIKVKPTE
jgi:aspartyl-tRNA synthetase